METTRIHSADLDGWHSLVLGEIHPVLFVVAGLGVACHRWVFLRWTTVVANSSDLTFEMKGEQDFLAQILVRLEVAADTWELLNTPAVGLELQLIVILVVAGSGMPLTCHLLPEH